MHLVELGKRKVTASRKSWAIYCHRNLPWGEGGTTTLILSFEDILSTLHHLPAGDWATKYTPKTRVSAVNAIPLLDDSSPSAKEHAWSRGSCLLPKSTGSLLKCKPAVNEIGECRIRCISDRKGLWRHCGPMTLTQAQKRRRPVLCQCMKGT